MNPAPGQHSFVKCTSVPLISRKIFIPLMSQINIITSHDSPELHITIEKLKKNTVIWPLFVYWVLTALRIN